MAAQPAATALPAQIGDDMDEAFEYVSEHVIGLDTQAKRDRILINAGVRNAYNLLLIDIEGLTDNLTATTSGLVKMRLKTLRKCAEETQDTFSDVAIYGLHT
jgi:predicted methyltransferase MtxX (methanogen marker protein 4)